MSLTPLRQFWAGVCKVPDQLELIRSSLAERDAIQRRLDTVIWSNQELSRQNAVNVRNYIDVVGTLNAQRDKCQDLEQQLAAEREAHNETKAVVDSIRDSWVQLQAQLVAEREAHEETRRKLGDVIASAEEAGWNGVENPKNLCDFIEYMGQELASVCADLDALMTWRAIHTLPIDLPIDTVVLYATTDNPEGATLERPSFLRSLLFPERYVWRHTPDSLAAWKAREGAGDGL